VSDLCSWKPCMTLHAACWLFTGWSYRLCAHIWQTEQCRSCENWRGSV
jgi:hypothetical protein